MLVFPNCKINIGLHIISKRDDGYHNIETAFYPIPLHDVLEIITSDSTNKEVEFSMSGNKIDGNTDQNLCVKAYHLLKNEFPQLPNIKMHLHKIIPTGAGLGGGSADGAFALSLLNKKFSLGLSTQQLIDHALQLGSDCPFFIINQPCFATSRGEILQEIALNLSGYKIAVINPGIHVNTAQAFSQIRLQTPVVTKTTLSSLIYSPVTEWKNTITNDFEPIVFAQYPDIKKIKDQLYQSGAVYASMSGSGSTVYGIFANEIPPDLSFPDSYYTKTIQL
ncbi:4-(cytidine 5'-diphospho)-2-C-methyl-D-erythritol kinase [Ferruginibacter lapsinanis]|uniref:4-(cytidine 5'-diphospho)-2-C-methyl-D-erythritol kinase n=1 Tax=Ferruginibacter lapsinanis TaxID=563172 RepID=UPI001E483EA6|nr:4-(cytidine 5'-diphospho)-2-C-methyl-D-erythritol kinase [Ferruginibacter lapsinanis]UEG49063.1 4-(cytidine 5'-diphospho)-2-C-methyl-D-erythritol kinase [Ferruginibacter lapsinanis]